MRKFLKKGVSILLASSMVLSICNLSCLAFSFAENKGSISKAASQTYGDFGYEVSNGNAIITGFTGGKTVANIPSSINGYSVTEIKDNAFLGDEITSVKFPNTLKTIGEAAFSACKSIESVKIPDSVTTVKNGAFLWCSNLSSVVLSNNLKNISFKAFSLCYGIKNVAIPYGVTTIGEKAFNGSYQMETVTIPSSVTSIGDKAFNSENMTIYGTSGSYAQTYAKNNNLKFVAETPMSSTGVTTGGINVRTGASTGYPSIGTLSKGSTVQIVAKNSETGWYKIKYNGNYAYVSYKYVKLNETSENLPVIKTGVTTSSLNVRKGPSTSYSAIGKLSSGTKVQIVAVDSSTGWYKIKYGSGYGYISYKYVKLDGEKVTSTLKITNANYPTTISEGSPFTLTGTISSNYKITYVRVQVLNSAGKAVSTASKTVYPNAYSYSKIDSGIKFGTLSSGNYTYQVIAKDASGTQKTLVNRSFTVKAVSVIKTGVTTSSLNVRKGPSTSYSIIGKLSSGTKVQIVAVDSSTGWYKIKYGSGYGYISYKYVKLDGATSNAFDSYIKNTLIPKYGIANLSSKSISGNLDNRILLSNGISDISFRDLNGDSQKEMIVTIKLSQTSSFKGDKYRIEVYSISSGNVYKLEGTIEDFYVLQTGPYNNHNFNVFTKSYGSGEYLFIENYVTGYGDGGNITELYMYKMVGSNIVFQRRFWNSISYVASEPDYVCMTYIELDKNGNSIYSIPSKGGYYVNNFDRSSCRTDFDNKVVTRMSNFGLSGLWKNYMQNLYSASNTSSKYYINSTMKKASLRQSGANDLFRMQYMPNSSSSGTISFYNYNGNYLSNFK